MLVYCKSQPALDVLTIPSAGCSRSLAQQRAGDSAPERLAVSGPGGDVGAGRDQPVDGRECRRPAERV